MSYASAGGWAMPCASPKPPEYRFARAAEIDVANLTPAEADEADVLAFRKYGPDQVTFGPAQEARLDELIAKTQRNSA